MSVELTATQLSYLMAIVATVVLAVFSLGVLAGY
jgi:hypothetical protein